MAMLFKLGPVRQPNEDVTMFDLETQAILDRIADALEHIAKLIEEVAKREEAVVATRLK